VYKVEAYTSGGVTAASQELSVTTPQPIGFTPQYNGNIAGMEWGTEKNNATETGLEVRRYHFLYDSLNRLTNTQYLAGGTATGMMNETGIKYDLNGNIQTLQRVRPNGSAPQTVDMLEYKYLNNSNQLEQVIDSAEKTIGFIDGNTSGADYSYDANGNLTADKNKKISTIQYNYLNLPEFIKFIDNSSIRYIYDASGVKLRKVAKRANGDSTVTDYCGELEFTNKALSLAHTEEGIITFNGTGAPVYQYFLKDHLGNTRVVIDQSGTVTQKTDYYPFGATSWSAANSVNNKYLYNGKEKQDEFGLDWYDYGARFYDPMVGRFTSVDGYLEKYYALTPYQYGLNNPISFIDINGDSAWSVKREWNEDDIKAFAAYAQKKLSEYEKAKVKINCADVALNILVGYASENGLALTLKSADSKDVFDSNSDKYNSVSDYLNGTKDENGKTVKGALSLSVYENDIQYNTFSPEYSERQPGDMAIIYSPIHHVVNYYTDDKIIYGSQDQNFNATEVRLRRDWTRDPTYYGKPMFLFPDRDHVNRWNVLNIRTKPPLPLKSLPSTGVQASN
jgi:RHS repeat-associated protein